MFPIKTIRAMQIKRVQPLALAKLILGHSNQDVVGMAKGEGSLGLISFEHLIVRQKGLSFKNGKSVFIHRALQHQRLNYRAISSSAASKFLALYCLLFAISQPRMSAEQEKKKDVVRGET